MTQPQYPDSPQPGGQQYVPGYQGMPQAPPVPAGYGYGAPQQMNVPPGMYYDPASELILPQGVQLASVGRRIGAYFLSLLLLVVTLGIGYLIWGLISWSKGRGPTQQVLGMRCWTPANGRVATWGTMALRDIVGGLAQGILGAITGLISFILFLSNKQHKSLMDMVGSTVVLYDPNKVLDNWQG
ncbi:RDD family protein [Catenulispora pinisilvae]|uniref:RDD family protein n=1 Tax=Catenulispora pinisilvae TaxID=2705253 RepID=UPI001891B88B|nr:RDD family protein [Catenulispora pinisilvae]